MKVVEDMARRSANIDIMKWWLWKMASNHYLYFGKKISNMVF
jgi:hypothetical protein